MAEKGIYEIIRGDLLYKVPEDRKVLVAHISNDIGVWGRGFTAALDKRWPTVGQSYCAHMEHAIQTESWVLGSNHVDYVDNFKAIVCMIAQHGLPGVSNPSPLKYAALVECMRAVCRLAIRDGYEIHCPKFGSGIARGNWEVIQSLIQELWVDEGVDVHVWYL